MKTETEVRSVPPREGSQPPFPTPHEPDSAGDPHRLDTTSTPVPLYQQMKRYIIDRIESGYWAAGSRIPSEKQFSEKFGVARMTVNRALKELTDGGQLIRIQGLGTFVATRKPQVPLLEVNSIAEEIQSRGGIHSSQVYLLEEMAPGTDLAAEMELPPGSAVYHSILLHFDRSIPVQLEERFVKASAVPGYIKQDFTRITPSQYLLEAAPLTEVEHRVEAVLPDKRIRKLLKTRVNEPCLQLSRRTWSFGELVTRSIFIYPGSRYQFGSRFKTDPGRKMPP